MRKVSEKRMGTGLKDHAISTARLEGRSSLWQRSSCKVRAIDKKGETYGGIGKARISFSP